MLGDRWWRINAWTELNWTELNWMHEWMIDLKCRKGQQQTKATCFCNAGQANFRASWNAWWEIVPMWISVLDANISIDLYIYMSIKIFFTSVTLWCKFQPPQTHLKLAQLESKVLHVLHIWPCSAGCRYPAGWFLQGVRPMLMQTLLAYGCSFHWTQYEPTETLCSCAEKSLFRGFGQAPIIDTPKIA